LFLVFCLLSAISLEEGMTRLGVGIIGTGWGVRAQTPAFRAAGLEVVALAGSQAAKTARIAADLSVPWSTGNWRELLERSDVSLVSITTPPLLHREMAIAALEAGKHVLCEKPTALNSAEAEAMLAAAQAHPEQLALIDHELRFLPIFRTARQLVAAGKIGRLRHAEARIVGGSRADPQRPWNWWSDVQQGGGALAALGSHQIDQLRYVLDDEVAAARGLINTFITERPAEPDGTPTAVTADDFTAFQLRFRQGGVALAVVSLVVPASEPNSLTLYGDAGVLRITGGRLFQAGGDGNLRDVTPPHTVIIPPDISGDFPIASIYLGQALRAALEGDRTALAPAATFGDGLQVQRVLDAVRCSNDAGWTELA
jgi:predicted dehydrogenase